MLSAALILIGFQMPRLQTGEEIAVAAWQEAAKASATQKPIDDKSPQGQIDHDTKSDIELGMKYCAEVEKQYKLSTDVEIQKRVKRIGAELAAIANATDAIATWGDKRHFKFDYTFKVIQQKDPNAFSLPGGFVYVHDSLVTFTESDDELAGVLAHEIAHAAFRHVATLQRESGKLEAFQIPLILAAILTGQAGALGTVLTATDLAGTAFTSGWSQKAEQAADYGGFQYMTKSPYNPTGMITFMERLAREERMQPTVIWGIYRTHPPTKERADALTADMLAAGLPIQRSKVSASFRAVLKPSDDGTVNILFGTRKIAAVGGIDAVKRADEAVAKINAFFDSVPEMFEVKSGEEGQIMGRQAPLMTITHEDAVSAKSTVKELQESTVKSLRSALFTLAYRIWDGR